MGVYIKGIKKPDRCFICPLKYYRGMYYYCTIKEMQGVDSCISKNTMSVVCPLSELPPHRDLIERDALVYAARVAEEGIAFSALEVEDMANRLPVIIPADKEVNA